MKNVLTPEQIALVASKAGFSDDTLLLAVAIALAESGGDALAQGDKQLAPYGSYGLWQINSHAHPNLIGLPADPSKWYDPYVNATFAWKVSNHGKSFRPWSVYIHKTYTKHLAAAKAGIAAYKANPSTVKAPKIVAPSTTTSSYPNSVNIRLVSSHYMRDGENGITGIKKAQMKLEEKGFSVGEHGTDGIYGPDTRNAIVAFQQKNPPLEVDGILGPLTWAKLFD